MKNILATLATGFLIINVAKADNWSQFRGPLGQNVSCESGIPVRWSADTNVAWRIDLPGQSWSSPIVWEDRIFVTTATDGGEACHILALDRKTGSVLWDKVPFKQTLRRKEGRNTYATPTPATDGQRVYACFGDGSFVALNDAGEIVWTNRDYPFYGQHGLATSPILHAGLLIMARDGSSDGEDKKVGWQKPWDQAFIVALDTRTGKERWKAHRGLSRISHGAPALWEHDGKVELVSEAGDVVQGFNVETGERLWSSEVIGEGKVPSTVLGDGMVFTSGGWGGRESIKAFRLTAVDQSGSLPLIWEQKKGMPKVPSMVYVKPLLFAVTDGGVATCMRGGTGEIAWQERLGGSFSASAISAEGRVYFISDEGETTVVEAGPELKILSKNPLAEKVQASPAVSRGHLYVRTEKHLISIGSK
jgi:outer membrane protein assembly factor BamB